jgi:hypothetical protein
MTFDLSDVESSDYRRMRTTVLLIRLLLVALLVIGGVGMAFALPRLIQNLQNLAGRPEGPWVLGLLVAILVYICIVATLLAQSVRHRGRGPVRVEVTPDGFSLSWSDGCSRSWAWDNLRGSVRLTDSSGGSTDCPASIQLSMAGSGALSGAACEAIVQSAEARGLVVRTSEFAETPYIAKHNTIVIRRSP